MFSDIQSKKLVFLFLGFLLFVNLSIRLMHLEADAPLSFPNKYRVSGPWKDEAAKAYEARSKALFGSFNTSVFDEYQIWRIQSPMWVYPLASWFKAFGVSYASIRCYALVFGIGTLLISFFIAKKLRDPLSGLITVTVLGFNVYFILYSRLGLIEISVTFWLSLTAMILVMAPERKGAYLLAALSFIFSILAKPNGLLFFPAILGVLIYDEIRPEKDHGRHLSLHISIAIIILVPVLLLAAGPWRNLLLGNISHVAGNHSRVAFSSETSLAFLPIIKIFFYNHSPLELYRGFFLLLPVVSIMGLVELFYGGYICYVKRKLDRGWMLLALWFGGAWFAANISHFNIVRFWLMIFPPSAILAGIAFSRLLRPGKMWKSSLALILLLLSCGYGLYFWGLYVSNPRYSVVKSSRMVGQFIGDKAVLIGEWAVPLCIETRSKCYYVKEPFNQSAEQLEAFGVTHIAVSERDGGVMDYSVKTFAGHFPEIFSKRKPIYGFRIMQTDVQLYSVAK